MSGYAWAGGGRKILRVDLTGDGGRTWTQAHTLKWVPPKRNQVSPKKFDFNPGKMAQDLHDTGVGLYGREEWLLGKATRFLVKFVLTRNCNSFAILSHIFNH